MVPDASIVPVTSTADVVELMNQGQKNRAVGSTAINDRSSRSHRFGLDNFFTRRSYSLHIFTYDWGIHMQLLDCSCSRKRFDIRDNLKRLLASGGSSRQ